MSSTNNVWSGVVDELQFRKEEGALTIRKDLFCMFYKEHQDIQKACELANVATAWLAKEPNLDSYDQLGDVCFK